MSGEAGGVLVGGVVALAVAPVVIAGAATLGLAYGALKIGGFLGKQALDYAAEKKREKELVVGQCSVQLDSLYSQMRSVVRDETNQHAKIVDEMSEQFKQIGLELKDLYDRKPSADELDKNINISRNEVSAKLGSESSIIRDNLISKGRKSLYKCIETIEKSNAEKAELIQWADKTAASVEMQKAAAMEMLRDAEASYRVIESMAKSSKDTNFVNQVRTIFLTLQRSRSMMDQAMYQGAFSNARTVVRECAITASEHVQDELESDMLIMELRARIEGLFEEMSIQRYLEFVDETRKNKKEIRVDLNNFSQGKYKKMLDSLTELSEKLNTANNTSLYEISQISRQFDEEIEPEARHITDYSHRIMKGYYDRLHVLEVVADFMTEQDYKMDWAMPVGGDASQKLVVHFVQKMTGNTISVTLDNDVETNDIAKMAMEILTFYGSGRPVTENEKRELREHLNAALNKAGIGGQLGCQGKVNQASDQLEMNNKESVKKMQTKSIL